MLIDTITSLPGHTKRYKCLRTAAIDSMSIKILILFPINFVATSFHCSNALSLNVHLLIVMHMMVIMALCLHLKQMQAVIDNSMSHREQCKGSRHCGK